MKRLQLLRHAKSSWDDPALADIDRPLNKRGKWACQTMAGVLARSADFSHVFCSPAKRAQATLTGLSEALRDGLAWHTLDELYTFDAQALLPLVRALPDSAATVLLVGHNPALLDLANLLGDRRLDTLPTCGFVAIDLPIDDWRGLNTGSGHLVEFLYPKLVAEQAR